MRNKLISQVSALSPLGGAIDGTRKRRRRGPRKANPNSSVVTGAVCYCGERFDDFRDAYLHVRNGCSAFALVDEMKRLVEHISVAEAAKRLGISDRAVRMRIVAGRLPAKRLGGRAWTVEWKRAEAALDGPA